MTSRPIITKITRIYEREELLNSDRVAFKESSLIAEIKEEKVNDGRYTRLIAYSREAPMEVKKTFSDASLIVVKTDASTSKKSLKPFITPLPNSAKDGEARGGLEEVAV